MGKRRNVFALQGSYEVGVEDSSKLPFFTPRQGTPLQDHKLYRYCATELSMVGFRVYVTEQSDHCVRGRKMRRLPSTQL
jgi:hypothetical protein